MRPSQHGKPVAISRSVAARPDLGTSRHRALVENAPICIHEVDLDGRLVSMNPAGLALMGYRDVSEVRGLRYLDGVAEHDRPRIAAKLDAALRGQRSSFEFEPLLPGPSRVFSASLVPIRGADGRVESIMGMAEDTTFRHATAQEQRESEERFRRIIETAIDIVAVVDRNGVVRFQSASVEELLGFRSDEMAGRSIADFVHPDDVGEPMSGLAGIAGEPGASARAAFRIRHKNGEWRHLESIARNMLDDPLVRGFVVTSRDVTGQRLAEAQLRHAQKMEALGNLTGGVAHDFNNLLGVALGNLERAAAAAGHQRDLHEPITAAIAAVERGANLTQQLLAFSRKQTLRPEALDLNHHVEQTAALLRRTLRARIDVRTRLGSDLWRTRADPTQLENALLNLALNARDAMPAGGSIDISTANVAWPGGPEGDPDALAAGEYVQVSIRDDGEGMSPEVCERAVEPFYTTKAEGRGSGLGLSMVYGFARQSGGHARIDSWPGRGTTVSLLLPRSLDEPKARLPSAPDIESWRAKDQRVLLVEDQPAMRRLLQRQLGSLELTVSAAGSGAEALELLEELGPIDLLVSDVGLPGGMLGPELAVRVRERQPGVPVLLMTGFAEDDLTAAPGLEGAELLQKPFRHRDVAARVRRLLGGSLEQGT